MTDLKKLTEGLEKLSGYDLESVEREERAAGNRDMEPTFTKSFQIRLAARALGLNVHDLKSLPAKEYIQLTATVLGFLIRQDSDESTT